MKPWAPAGDPAGGQRYVSDVLEGLLDAGETRRAMRAYAVALLNGVPDTMREQLEPVAEYVGGKCMGYPAIWFLEHLLAESAVSREEIIESAGATLALSLSTSIVDDLADGDEPVSSAYLAFLYVLLGREIFSPREAQPESLASLYRALDICLNPTAENGDEATQRRGGRIGAFYATIARRVLDRRWARARAEIALAAIERFGEFCAHIDDWMDAERDFARGVEENVTVALLRAHVHPHRPAASDISRHDAWLRAAFAALLTKQLAQIVAMLEPLRTEALLDELSQVVLRLPVTFETLAVRPRTLLRSV